MHYSPSRDGDETNIGISREISMQLRMWHSDSSRCVSIVENGGDLIAWVVILNIRPNLNDEAKFFRSDAADYFKFDK